jgi:hypothetical protein
MAGLFVALALLKFGNPCILDRMIEAPRSLLEAWFQAWPIAPGYFGLLVLSAAGAVVGRVEPRGERWLTWLPCFWLAWQVLSMAAGTLDAGLSRVTLAHFTACVACFYIGCFALARCASLQGFFLAVLVGLAGVLWLGFNQHYGGLEETRRFFYAQPNWREFPPDYIKKIGSDRIFASLVYPNALAGALMLLAPAAAVAFWQWLERWPFVLRATLTGLLIYAAAACLYWSGSKGGWLIALAAVGVGLLRLPMRRATRLTIVTLIVALGLGAFFGRFSAYFQAGAKSVGARFDYWRAAALTIQKHPWFGSGPGTFQVAYRAVKPAEAEMTKLAHNDYLQQGSDSGLVGMLAYVTLVGGVLARRFPTPGASALAVAVWLGVFGWALQGLSEFSLYIPAISWPAFMLLGWLVAGVDDQSLSPRSAESGP